MGFIVSPVDVLHRLREELETFGEGFSLRTDHTPAGLRLQTAFLGDDRDNAIWIIEPERWIVSISFYRDRARFELTCDGATLDAAADRIANTVRAQMQPLKGASS